MNPIQVVVLLELVTEDGDRIGVGDSPMLTRDEWQVASVAGDALARARAVIAERGFVERRGRAKSTQWLPVEVEGPSQAGRYRVRGGSPGERRWGAWQEPEAFAGPALTAVAEHRLTYG